jgi:hypothetical protein
MFGVADLREVDIGVGGVEVEAAIPAGELVLKSEAELALIKGTDSWRSSCHDYFSAFPRR